MATFAQGQNFGSKHGSELQQTSIVIFFIEDKSRKKSVDSIENLESNDNILITSQKVLVQNIVRDSNKRVSSFFFIEDKSRKKSVDSIENLESNDNILITSPKVLVQNRVRDFNKRVLSFFFIEVKSMKKSIDSIENLEYNGNDHKSKCFSSKHGQGTSTKQYCHSFYY